MDTLGKRLRRELDQKIREYEKEFEEASKEYHESNPCCRLWETSPCEKCTPLLKKYHQTDADLRIVRKDETGGLY